MHKEYKKINDFMRSFNNELNELFNFKRNYVGFYTNDLKAIHCSLDKKDKSFTLYKNGRFYFSCPYTEIESMLFELQFLLKKYGTNKTIFSF